MALCKCDLPKQIEQVGSWDGCSLEGDAHTQFSVQRCKGCGGICGFPQYNFELALKEGTPETKKKLAEIINETYMVLEKKAPWAQRSEMQSPCQR